MRRVGAAPALALLKKGHAFETKCGGHRLRQVATPRSSASDRGFGILQPVTRASGRKPSRCTGTSKTGASPRSATSGRWHRRAPRLVRPPRRRRRNHHKPNDTCSTNSSANSTPARPALQRTPGVPTSSPACGLTFNFVRCLTASSHGVSGVVCESGFEFWGGVVRWWLTRRNLKTDQAS